MKRQVAPIAAIAVLVFLVLCGALLLFGSNLAKADRALGSGDQSRLALLTSIQNGIDEFHATHGDYPAVVSQLTSSPPRGWSSQFGIEVGGNGKVLKRLDKWRPYLFNPRNGERYRALPFSPLALDDPDSEKGNTGKGWDYDPKTGTISYASTRTNQAGVRWCDVRAERTKHESSLTNEASLPRT